ncbi:MAG: AIR synthase-related protein, partial [Candidatus Aminicenantes bacterium]|nr:AIR synthase-related protein [Candidatus Aminicenantes bacterium]
ISFAHQLDRAFPFNIQEISDSMAALNKEAAEVMRENGIRCGTDVTGFGLMGHLAEMVVQSKVTAEITTGNIPLFRDVLMFAQQDLISGAVERNREFASKFISFDADIGPDWQAVLFDPQTSGGILMAVPEKEADSVLVLLKEKGISPASIIGRIKEKSDGHIIVRSSR